MSVFNYARWKDLGEEFFHGGDPDSGLFVDDDHFLSKFIPFGTADAMSFLLVNFLLVGCYFSGRRRRDTASAGLGRSWVEMPNLNVLFDFLSQVDEDDCMALALCQVLAMERSDLTNEHKLFLNAFRLDPRLPLSWDELSRGRSKYEYATFIGQRIRKLHSHSENNSTNNMNSHIEIRNNNHTHHNPRFREAQVDVSQFSTCDSAFPGCWMDPIDIPNMICKINEMACKGYFASRDITLQDLMTTTNNVYSKANERF